MLEITSENAHQMIGTRATDTEPPIWPELDQLGNEYIKNGISTVNLSPTKFAVVSAGHNPDYNRINALKEHVADAVIHADKRGTDWQGNRVPTLEELRSANIPAETGPTFQDGSGGRLAMGGTGFGSLVIGKPQTDAIPNSSESDLPGSGPDIQVSPNDDSTEPPNDTTPYLGRSRLP